MYAYPILYDLFLGKINPNESLKPRVPEYTELNVEAAELENKFVNILTSEQREYFDAMQEAQGSVAAMEVREAFIIGFKLGARITLETVYTGPPSYYEDRKAYEPQSL